MTEDAAKVPAIGISLNVQIDNKRTLCLQSHCDATASASELNDLLDKIGTAADRQQAKYELEGLEFQLAQNRKLYPRAVEDFAVVQERHDKDWARRNRRGAVELTPQQEQEKRNAENLISRIKGEIEALEIRIAEQKQKIAA